MLGKQLKVVPNPNSKLSATVHKPITILGNNYSLTKVPEAKNHDYIQIPLATMMLPNYFLLSAV